MEYASTKLLESLQRPLPVHKIQTQWTKKANIQIDILRLDLLHPDISGNKWFKLKYNLAEAQKRGIHTVLSFGGAWSNHIHALAAAGYHLGMDTMGVIRGEPVEPLSDTLQDAERWGMQLHFVTRQAYRNKQTPSFQKRLLEQLGLALEGVWWVPEGGNNVLGALGCEEILASGQIRPEDYQSIWLACGTGATLAGVVKSAEGVQVTGVPVIKGGGYLQQEIHQYTGDCHQNWSLVLDAHCGGYAKTNSELITFIARFEEEAGIPLEPVYTGKAMLALYKQAAEGRFISGSRILFIHTGGLQGRRGIIKNCG